MSNSNNRHQSPAGQIMVSIAESNVSDKEKEVLLNNYPRRSKKIGKYLVAEAPYFNEVDRDYYILPFLKFSHKKGWWVPVYIDTPSRDIEVKVSLEKYQEIVSNPKLLIESVFSLSYLDYQRWMKDSGQIQCNHHLKNGRQCKKPVTSGGPITLAQFVALTGKNCPVHGGMNAKAREAYYKKEGLHHFDNTNQHYQ
ncbi:hypothetical protein [Paraferrimonas sp. SM1919]|uniref:hypothetical protein n=1 Tax=Paraferrimonas sp. SM1919 TaxID=2662263 RepID=UPI0013D53B03|nr:hypothetical protein [Paraferrimonas sp. SM1919]